MSLTLKKNKILEKISINNVECNVCISQKFFDALVASNKLYLNRLFKNADVTIIGTTAIISINNNVQIMFDVNNIEKHSDRTIICGDNYTAIIKRNYSEFTEKFI